MMMAQYLFMRPGAALQGSGQNGGELGRLLLAELALAAAGAEARYQRSLRRHE